MQPETVSLDFIILDFLFKILLLHNNDWTVKYVELTKNRGRRKASREDNLNILPV